nr:MAG TPA: hypothetical protein [Caudoviricetes sp.]
MYWGLGLLPGLSEKWKVSPWGEYRFCAKGEIYFSFLKRLFWWYLRQLSSPCIYYFSSMFIVMTFAEN